MLALRRSQGFTMVELVMAMALFSMMMLVVSVGVIQLVKVYQDGTGVRNTQQASRFIAGELDQAIRNAGDVQVSASHSDQVAVWNGPNVVVDHDAICLYPSKARSQAVIFYIVARNAANNEYDLWREEVGNPGTCAAPATPTGERLNSTNVSVLQFHTVASAPATGVTLVDYSFVLAADSAVTQNDLASDASAIGGITCHIQSGSQFCSMSNLASTVSLRRVN